MISLTGSRRQTPAWHAMLIGAAVALAGASASEPPQPVVYVVAVDGVIDLGLAPLVTRVLEEAEDQAAAAVILEINTFGGRVDAAVVIRDALLRSKVRSVAFVNKRAISAGALITLAAERIAMATGATVGAATPVTIGAPGGPAQPVAEKTVSYMRKEFRATAESRNRSPLLAEAMVDADVEIKGVSAKGKLLTLTREEAARHGLVDIRADTLEEVLAALHLSEAQVRRISPTWAEEVVRFLTHPVVSSLLMSLGILGLIIELRVPGFGLPGLLGIGCLALFFWGHWLVRLAGWEELLLIGAGLLLLALEVFVVPGFGFTGVLGLLALMGGLGLSLLGSGATWSSTMTAVGQVAASLLVAILAALAILRFLVQSPFAQALVLKTQLPSHGEDTSAARDEQRWLGARGTTLTPLRPAGIARLGGERVDVVSEGSFIEVGRMVEVIRVDGNRVVVRRIVEQPERSEA